jgi:hypothetical protein
METVQDTISLIHKLEDKVRGDDKRIKDLCERNHALIKVIATVRQSLERAIKNPSSLLNKAVYDSVDLCRANFSYMDGSTGLNKIDPPLTEAEKTLP